jgi:uncharacterized protein (TIGR03083 family)
MTDPRTLTFTAPEAASAISRIYAICCLRLGDAPSIVARVLPLDADHAQRAMAVSYQAVTADLERLDEEDLARPSRCLGWTRADLLYHMLLDAQRALVAFATPATRMTDVDFVSYWAPFRPGAEGYDAHARFVRRASSAYRSDLVIVTQWSETAAAAVYAAMALPAEAKVATQGHVLAAGDFLATLAVEATIHHLDLVAGTRPLLARLAWGWLSSVKRLTAYSGSRSRLAGMTWATR